MFVRMELQRHYVFICVFFFTHTCRTALHLACAKGEGDIVHHLCSLKATVNVMDSEGATPMHKVCLFIFENYMYVHCFKPHKV